MKLIDLLVKKTKQEGWAWPVKSTFCYQTNPERGSRTKFFDLNGVKVVDYCWEKCDDASVFNKLTKEQYESALAKNDGWIEWGGGECPVETGVLVDIRIRNGKESHGVRANEHTARVIPEASHAFWRKDGTGGDIIAYRLHKPEINSLTNDDRLEQDLNECIGQDVDVPEWNGDGLPPVGCECEVKRAVDWVKCKILFISDTHVVLMADEECCWNTCACQFRPLRTEAEKLREKFAASLHIAAGASPIELNGIGPLYFKLADAIISGSVFGTTFKENK